MEAVCAHPDAVPLMGVKAAETPTPRLVPSPTGRHRPQAGPSGRAPGRSPVASQDVEAALAAKEQALGGRSLTAGQKAMAAGVATSGRGVELVVGVAGAGKSTALDASRRAFVAAGFKMLVRRYRARLLGHWGPRRESTSPYMVVPWRLDHGQLELTTVCRVL